ncbi:MAG: potassium channel protein [bacterium]|nr:potassium channel protein [bacterium]
MRVLGRFLLVLTVMVFVYSAGFHYLMLREGQEHSWLTGLYWTLTVMSTLGFGDITFHTDVGRAFSIVVLLSGMIFLLVLLPFTFIEFFYEPWMKAQAASRAPRALPSSMRGHVLLTNHDAVSSAIIRRLQQYRYPYALMVPEVDDALQLHDQGVNVMVGDLDDPEAWSRAQVESAALIASTANDPTNTSVAFTVRGIAKDVPILTSATDEASVDIMELAGSSYVLRLEEMIGQSFARRMVGGDAMSHVIGQFDDLLIAEATAHRTPLVGKTLLENRLRDKVGITVLGVWERGTFEPAKADTMINENTVLLLAGLKEHLFRYDQLFCIYNASTAPVVIIGGGRVGRATARALERRELNYRIVEVLPERIRDPEKYVLGSAADLEVLEQAGIRETATVIITTHDDDLNVYLTIYCRQLRPDAQIMSRATNERNVAKMHRAGADMVLSYASMGASAAMNLLERHKILMVAEGLDLFVVPVPDELAGVPIIESRIREDTGCSVVAIQTEHGMEAFLDPTAPLPADTDIVLIGTGEAEEAFLRLHGKEGT